MNEIQKLDWSTPVLVEYGGVAKLTEVPVKQGGSGDALLVSNLNPWTSGTIN